MFCRWHVLAEDGNKRKPERLVQIRDELVARHFRRGAVIVHFRFVRQVPRHVLRIPPRVLQSLPEQPRLPDSPNFMPPGNDPFLAILHHQLAQRVHQVRPQLFQPLVVRPQRHFRQRILLRRRRLAVHAKRHAPSLRPGGDAPAIQRRHKPVVSRLVLAIQYRQLIQIVSRIRHDVFLKKTF